MLKCDLTSSEFKSWLYWVIALGVVIGGADSWRDSERSVTIMPSFQYQIQARFHHGQVLLHALWYSACPMPTPLPLSSGYCYPSVRFWDVERVDRREFLDWTLRMMDWRSVVLKRLYWAGRQAAHRPRPDSSILQYRPAVQISIRGLLVEGC